MPVADTAAALWEPGRVLLLITACLSMTGFMMGNLLGTSRLVEMQSAEYLALEHRA